MPIYNILYTPGVESAVCQCKDDLTNSLQALARRLAGDPTLVELNDEADRSVLVGVGIPTSSLEVFDAATGVKHRALSLTHGDFDVRWEPEIPTEMEGDVWFSYMGGEATLISQRFLIPTSLALDAAVEWVVSAKLDTRVKWL